MGVNGIALLCMLVITAINLGILMAMIKLFTEWMKESKYRQK